MLESLKGERGQCLIGGRGSGRSHRPCLTTLEAALAVLGDVCMGSVCVCYYLTSGEAPNQPHVFYFMENFINYFLRVFGRTVYLPTSATGAPSKPLGAPDAICSALVAKILKLSNVVTCTGSQDHELISVWRFERGRRPIHTLSELDSILPLSRRRSTIGQLGMNAAETRLSR